MREYALVRQKPAYEDLLAIPFRIGNMDGLSFEIIEPEWIEGSYYSSGTAGTSNNADMKRAVVDCSKYDYVIYSITSKFPSTNVYAGTRPDTDPGQMQDMLVLRSDIAPAYAVADTTINNYLLLSQKIDNPAPIIGVIKES